MRHLLLLKFILAIGLGLSSTLGLSAPSSKSSPHSMYRPTSLDSVAKQVHRPRMIDLLQNSSFLNNPLDGALNSVQEATLRKNITDMLSTIIAQIEAAYPNARLVFLGRDAAYLGDLIDAFYIARGQMGRVIRLNVSRQSLNESPISLYLYLRQQGLVVTKDPNQAPIVFLDRTEYTKVVGSYASSSQLLQLLSISYSMAASVGVDNQILAQKIGGISLQNYRNLLLTGPKTIMSVNAVPFIDGNQTKTRSSPRQLNPHWHDTFGPMVIDANSGTLDSQLPKQTPSLQLLKQRQNMLRELQIGWEIVSSNDFRVVVSDQRISRNKLLRTKSEF